MVIYHETGRDALYKIWNKAQENMIICFHSGTGSIVFQDAIYPIEPSAICFVRAGKLHYTMPDNFENYNRSKIFLSDRRMSALLSSLPEGSSFYKLFLENSVVYARLPEDIYATAESLFGSAKRLFDLGRDEGLSPAFFSLMALLSEHSVHHIKSPNGFMAKAIEYINDNYYLRISLDELCCVVNMSKSHFCRSFKSAMGMTVSEYILKTRIAAAKTMLISSDLSISQISEASGFSSISYFCQTFVRAEGITANEYRRRQRCANLP